MNLASVCVFCGSNFNGDPKVETEVKELASLLASRKIRLVYGGGNVGLMGLIADAVLAVGGEVTGVIPGFLMEKEVGHTGLTELIVTGNMHQRKQKMADLSDGFIVLPGGFGTLEEFFEVLTWLQLGLHGKPVAVLNIAGFYDHLFAQMDRMVDTRYLKKTNRDLVINETEPAILLDRMAAYRATPDEVWFRERNIS